MRCSYCLQQALFKCGCQQPYMCGTHLGIHLATLGKHGYEHLDITLEESRLKNLRSDILRKIKKINKAEKLIVSKTHALIKSIKLAHKEAIQRLYASRKKFFEIIELDRFCNSDLLKIENIEMIEFDLKFVEIDKILTKTENLFGVEFTNYLEKRIVIMK